LSPCLRSGAFCGTTEELAEKVGKLNESGKQEWQGLKPELIFVRLIGPAEAVPLLQSPSIEIFSNG
jgi:hypothetical protein